MHNAKPYLEALEFIKTKHAGQFRAHHVPAWHHVVRVSETLKLLLEQCNEGGSEQTIIWHAALGHDLLEDTNATAEEILGFFGPRGQELIVGMTNRFGDNNPLPYVDQVEKADEGVRITKLADLFDNYSNAAYNLDELGYKWAHEYFIPIVKPMAARLRSTKFSTYANTAGRLQSLVDVAEATFLTETERFKPNA